MQDPWFVDPAVVERDLSMATNIIHFEKYNLVGGEPTLHPKLMKLVRIVRRSGIADWLEITTNGQGARRWPNAVYQEVDELIVTPYKLSDGDCMHLADKCAQYGTTLQWHPVILTYAAYKQEHSPDRAEQLYRTCWYNINRHVIDEGYFYRCCVGRFIPAMLQGLPKEHDAIPLEGLTEEKLAAYLKQDETPRGCYVCGSNCAPQVPWRETSRADWLKESLA
jgi:hypothetical protein